MVPKSIVFKSYFLLAVSHMSTYWANKYLLLNVFKFERK